MRSLLRSLWHVRAHTRMAEELKGFIDAYRYGDWIGNVAGGFDFNEMMKGWSGSRVRAAGAAWKAAVCLNAM